MSDLLPPSASAQERALSLAAARVGAVEVKVSDLWNPQTCPAAILPWLAWAMSVDKWDSSWTEQQQRDVIAASVEVHRHKGTIGALKAALRPLGYEIDVQEQAAGPYTFRLKVDFAEGPIDDAALDEARAIALRVKNVRSWLVGVNAMRVSRAGLFFACAGILGDMTTVYPYTVSNRDISGSLRWALAAHLYETLTVGTITAPPAAPARLLEDGTSYRLLEDGSKRLLE